MSFIAVAKIAVIMSTVRIQLKMLTLFTEKH